MSDITLVTPPDKYYTSEHSFLLIYPSEVIKEQFNDFVQQYKIPFVVYLYEQKDPNHEPEWLMDTFHAADYVIMDIDNCDPKVRDFASYFISKKKTFWLTNGENRVYNKLSINKIKNFEFLTSLGGQFEKEQ